MSLYHSIIMLKKREYAKGEAGLLRGSAGGLPSSYRGQTGIWHGMSADSSEEDLTILFLVLEQFLKNDIQIW